MKIFCCFLIILSSLQAASRQTLQDFQRAEAFTYPNCGALVYNAQTAVKPVKNSSSFYYLQHKLNGSKQYLLLKADGRRELLFNHQQLAQALNSRFNTKHTATSLPISKLKYLNDLQQIHFTHKNKRWTCSLKNWQLSAVITKVKTSSPANSLTSPDGSKRAFIKDYNLFLEDLKTKTVTQVSKGGRYKYEYCTFLFNPWDYAKQKTQSPQAWIGGKWSPDSKKFIYFLADSSKCSELGVLYQGGQLPKAYTYRYPGAGSAQLPQIHYLIYNCSTKKSLPVKTPATHATYYGWSTVDRWDIDQKHYYLYWWNRGYSEFRLYRINSDNGHSRIIYSDKSSSFIDFDMTYIRFYQQDKKMIVSSEKDGWCHLYRVDITSGKVEKQLTRGRFVVREIVRLDEKNNWLYFYASGREAQRDPYLKLLYRVSLNGGQVQLLTPENGEHSVTFSDDGKYFCDKYSRPDKAPVYSLRKVDGTLVSTFLKADISRLLQRGLTLPQPFKAKARNGKTDIYGLIWRPTNFDPDKKYPIIETVYSGPHGFSTPKTFNAWYYRQQALAELGFICVTVDGMGTAKRSKAFHDICYKNLGDGGFPDRITWIKSMAKAYPYADISRVGICGHSAGGYDTVRGMLIYPDFYKVGVSSAGNHDHALDKAGWVERWMGFPCAEELHSISNITNAAKLQGRLLLIHGDMDSNVNVSATLKLAASLQKAEKTFDMFIMPGFDHDCMNNLFLVKRWSFFYRHLKGRETPLHFKIRDRR